MWEESTPQIADIGQHDKVTTKERQKQIDKSYCMHIGDNDSQDI